MDRVAAGKLRPHEGRKLHRLKRQLSNAVNSRHAQIILLSHGGVCNREVAEKLGLSTVWVRELIHRFNHGGVDAILWYPCLCNQGSPRKFFNEVREQIAETALSPPQQLIGMAVWSLAKLREYLVEHKTVASISIEWLRQILRKYCIRWRHAKTWKESTDPDFKAKYKKLRKILKKRPLGGVRIAVDEFGPLNIQPHLGKHYAEIGHVDRQRATYKRTQGVRHFFGAYHLERDQLVGRFEDKKNSSTFLSFLRWLRRKYRRGGTLHIIMDNIGFHLTDEIVEYAATHDIRFYLTPTGASWLNPIESHFTALRKFALDDTDYRSHPEQEAAIFSYLKWRNGRRPISVADQLALGCEATTASRQSGHSKLANRIRH